jgi:hypothetical protein
LIAVRFTPESGRSPDVHRALRSHPRVLPGAMRSPSNASIPRRSPKRRYFRSLQERDRAIRPAQAALEVQRWTP